jgi:hypothetical protein
MSPNDEGVTADKGVTEHLKLVLDGLSQARVNQREDRKQLRKIRKNQHRILKLLYHIQIQQLALRESESTPRATGKASRVNAQSARPGHVRPSLRVVEAPKSPPAHQD